MHVRLLRKSDFNPTRMIGVVGQKCRTSGYHLEDVNIKMTVLHSEGFGCLPCPQHSPEKQGSQSQSKQTADPSRGMTMGANDHILPVQQYPTMQARPSSRRPGGWSG